MSLSLGWLHWLGPSVHCWMEWRQWASLFYLLPFFKRFYLFTFRQRGREGEREGEKHQLWLPLEPPTGDLACNTGMCPDWELNQRLFGSQAGAQSTESHQPGLLSFIVLHFCTCGHQRAWLIISLSYNALIRFLGWRSYVGIQWHGTQFSYFVSLEDCIQVGVLPLSVFGRVHSLRLLEPGVFLQKADFVSFDTPELLRFFISSCQFR